MPHRWHPDATFEPVELPTGRQELPGWLRGLHVSWMEGYSNPPHYTLLCPSAQWVRDHLPQGHEEDRLSSCDWRRLWPEPSVFREERPGFFVARHEDGRLRHLSHEPLDKMTWRDVEVGPVLHYDALVGGGSFSSYDQALSAARAFDPRADRTFVRLVRATERRLVSSKSEGFGGSHFDISVERRDGEVVPVRLVGPRHGVPPAGYVECGADPGGALTVTEDLWLRAVATFQPHLVVYRVREGHRPPLHPTELQVAQADWGCPKAWLPREHPVHSFPASPVLQVAARW